MSNVDYLLVSGVLDVYYNFENPSFVFKFECTTKLMNKSAKIQAKIVQFVWLIDL